VHLRKDGFTGVLVACVGVIAGALLLIAI